MPCQIDLISLHKHAKQRFHMNIAVDNTRKCLFFTFQYIDPSTIPQVRPNCQARRCYYFCRLKLLGGGRCTGGGCMCYAGFFAYDGSPLTRQYPEDDLWFDLTSDEQTQIRTEMARFR